MAADRQPLGQLRVMTNVRTVGIALSKLGRAEDILKISIYGLGCKSTQPVDIEGSCQSFPTRKAPYVPPPRPRKPP